MNNRIKLLRLNSGFFIGGILFLTLGYQLQSWHFEWGLLLTELLLVLGLALLIIKSSQARVGDYFLFKEVGAGILLKTAVIALASLPVVMILNLISLLILEITGSAIAMEIPETTGFSGVVFQFFIISIVAGIAEEILFRGVFLQVYRDYFKAREAIVFSAALFALFHFNLQNFFGPLYLGIVFGVLTVKTQSLIPAILGHMLNNGIAYVFSYMATFMPQENLGDFGVGEIIETILALSLSGALSLGMVVFLLRSIKNTGAELPRQQASAGKLDFLPVALSVGIYLFYGALVFF
ncbi:MAG: hypothetical protein AVO33_08635 [delta proteobacterium ML8_F1]|nr:MAG: hypothetical protein AVO33_08635 [delta proteobacterium ML8_F1]